MMITVIDIGLFLFFIGISLFFSNILSKIDTSFIAIFVADIVEKIVTPVSYIGLLFHEGSHILLYRIFGINHYIVGASTEIPSYIKEQLDVDISSLSHTEWNIVTVDNISYSKSLVIGAIPFVINSVFTIGVFSILHINGGISVDVFFDVIFAVAFISFCINSYRLEASVVGWVLGVSIYYLIPPTFLPVIAGVGGVYIIMSIIAVSDLPFHPLHTHGFIISRVFPVAFGCVVILSYVVTISTVSTVFTEVILLVIGLSVGAKSIPSNVDFQNNGIYHTFTGILVFIVGCVGLFGSAAYVTLSRQYILFPLFIVFSLLVISSYTHLENIHSLVTQIKDLKSDEGFVSVVVVSVLLSTVGVLVFITYNIRFFRLFDWFIGFVWVVVLFVFTGILV